MFSQAPSLRLVSGGQQPAREQPRHPELELLDERTGFLGMGRSLTFPFPQWRDNDAYRTVFFDEGEGHPVVFVHGLGANATHFERVAVPLARRYRTVGLDLVGCGWSLKPRVRYTVDLLRDHLLSFLDRRGIERATLVGHSLGGAVCLAAGLRRPSRVDGVVLLCAAGVARLPAYMRLAAPVMLRRQLLYPFFRFGHSFILDNVFVDHENDNEHVRWFRRSALRDAPGYPNLDDFVRVCETLCPDVARRDYSPRFRSLPFPVLGVWGDSDRLTSVGPVLMNLGRIPRVRTVVVRRCGHMPMVERPEETLFHLERFLDNPP
jgi:pimeloyl-ACP methyl ester carboxylesterase